MKIIVISPTYNEAENVRQHIINILSINIKLDLLIIDDSSPDGTAIIVKKLQKEFKNLHLLERPMKEGLGTAYIIGFKWALKNGYQAIIQIDADLSHDSRNIPAMLDLLKRYDMIVGSRYIDGFNVVNWPLHRLLLSYFANVYSRILMGIKVKDMTSGYNCFKAEILDQINYNDITSQGYSFQIEFKYLSYLCGFLIHEHPIVFHDRTVGKSKMSKQIVFEAIFKVLTLKCKKMFGLI